MHETETRRPDLHGHGDGRQQGQYVVAKPLKELQPRVRIARWVCIAADATNASVSVCVPMHCMLTRPFLADETI